jgi:ABC-type molybdate transport system permease subunit
MLSLLRFLVKLALLALVFAFASAIDISWLFTNPEVTTKSLYNQFHHPKHAKK